MNHYQVVVVVVFEMEKMNSEVVEADIVDVVVDDTGVGVEVQTAIVGVEGTVDSDDQQMDRLDMDCFCRVCSH